MSGWKVIIWARLASQLGSRRASVGEVDGTMRRVFVGGRAGGVGGGRGGGGGRSEAAVVRGGQAEDVAELPLGGDQVGRLVDVVEPEAFELLGGLGDVRQGALADEVLGLLALEDLLAELDGRLARPVLH